jgi:ribosomal protein S18 acetylase RimI-like enzyme
MTSQISATIRRAVLEDRTCLRQAIVELQDYECRMHTTRLPGEQIADAYLAWVESQTAANGALLVAEIDGRFVGFVAGWIEQAENIAETADSNRVGFISDICVMPAFRGQRIARQLLAAIEEQVWLSGISRLRICSLAANAAARASYEFAGFAPYEIIYEKVVGRTAIADA